MDKTLSLLERTVLPPSSENQVSQPVILHLTYLQRITGQWRVKARAHALDPSLARHDASIAQDASAGYHVLRRLVERESKGSHQICTGVSSYRMHPWPTRYSPSDYRTSLIVTFSKGPERRIPSSKSSVSSRRCRRQIQRPSACWSAARPTSQWITSSNAFSPFRWAPREND